MPETETVAEPGVNPVEAALALEDGLRAYADSVESGPNSDALKASIRNAAHGIGHIRKALDANERVERP